jgi:hypothetical protein
LLAPALLVAISACKHPLAIVGKGDIVDRNGTGYGCTFEQSQNRDPACAGNTVTGDYFVNYEAIPRPGWTFSHWEGPCGHLSEAPYCRFDVPAAAVASWDAQYADIEIPATVAVFERLPGTGNSAPVAVVGEDAIVYVGTQVTLDGAGSYDREGDALTYHWSGTSPPGTSETITDFDTEYPYFTANHAGTYTFELRVDDGNLRSKPARVVIEVIPASREDGQAYAYAFGSFDVVFLGCRTCNEFQAESIHNNLGDYGSSLSATSIRNARSVYGSFLGGNSACNAAASNPPQLWNALRTDFYGRLSIGSRTVNGICNRFSGYYQANACSLLQFYCGG